MTAFGIFSVLRGWQSRNGEGPLQRDRFADSLPKSMLFALPAQHGTITAKAPEKRFAPHPTTTGSCLASGGKARRDSSRLCSRMSAIASRKFARHSSCVRPWPFAPGSSAQYDTNQGPSCSTIAVNSLRMTTFYSERPVCKSPRQTILPGILTKNARQREVADAGSIH